MSRPKLRHFRKLLFVGCAALALTPIAGHAATAPSDRPVKFDIAPEDLGKALTEFGQQSEREIVFSADAARGKRAPAVKGELAPSDALGRLLSGTGLTYRTTATGSIVVEGGGTPSEPRPKQLGDANGASPSESEAAREEIVVTGTHIRGVSPASPVITIDRAEIERSGYSNVGDVMRSLPQNFAGGNSPQIQTGNAPGQNSSTSGGSAPNLRGLGSTSTLTLVNGHRLADDTIFGAVDTSLIPLDAVERSDVVTDGASAIYGSDAVAGVVNFVLRKDYDGAQTRLTYGGATEGGANQYIFSQLVGTRWSSGGIVASYEYAYQDPVYAAQRKFTSSSRMPYTLLPSSNRNSLFISGHQDLSDGVDFFVDGLYTKRKSTNIASQPSYSDFATAPVDQYQIDAGFNVDLPLSWRLNLTGTIANQTTTASTDIIFKSVDISPPYSFQDRTAGTMHTVEAVADGPLLTLPSGEIHASIGGGYRDESYGETVIYAGSPETPTSGKRNIYYAFGELSVPLVAPSDQIWRRRLELNLSGRYEHYSDFGSSTVPKVGLVYEPLSEIAIKASFGHSFNAPSLYSLNSPIIADLLDVPDPHSPTQSSPILITEGGNTHLKPEKATTWTASVAYSPKWLPDLHWTNTYFNISYSNRLARIPNLFTALTDPANAGFVSLSPSAAFQQQIINGALASSGEFFNDTAGPYDPAAVAAYVQYSSVNISQQNIQGFDSVINYEFTSGASNFNIFGNATYLEINEKLTPTAPQQQIAGTVFSPPKFRARGGVSWANGGWSASGILNYLDGSRNIYQQGNSRVSPWTTVDVQVSYKLDAIDPIMEGFSVTVSAENLFDADPSYVQFNTYRKGLNYDNVNSSPIGRLISVQLAKKW